MTETQLPAANPEPAPSPQPAPVRPERNVVGIVAFILAVVGFVFACIPGALIVGWILLPVAFVLSIVGLVLRGKKKAFALTGLIVSIVGTIVGVIVFVGVVASSFNDAFGGTDSTVVESGDDEDAGGDAAPQSEVGTRENPAAVGSTITGDEYTVVINSVTLDADEQVLAANMFNEAADEGLSYILVNASVTYTGDDSGFAALVGIDYVTSTGEVITQADTMAVAPDPALGIDELYNGGTATGNIVLAIPTGDAGALRIRPGIIADDVFVALQ